MFGFVIVRHVNSNTTNEYWKLSYQHIRKYYDNPILIVDDNSDPEYLKEDITTTNCQIVKGEFPGVGELLGYYYFHKTHFVEKAVIIHDSVFINKYINFDNYGDAKTIWSFTHTWDLDHEILKLIKSLDHSDEVLKLYFSKTEWSGSFGLMNVITWNLLNLIDSKYQLFNKIIPQIKCREDRCSMERIFPCLCQSLYPNYRHPQHIINDIMIHGWGTTYQQFKSGRFNHLPIIKVWTGR